MNKTTDLARSAPAMVDRLEEVIAWVVTAPVEDVCWQLTEIGSVREWLRVQKAATDLRIRAVRLEMVALRRVASGGLAAKIAGSGELRVAAVWLSTLTDEEFDTVLRELDGERTPIGLFRDDRAQREALAKSLGKDQDSQWERRISWDRSRADGEHFRRAVSTVLDEVLEVGEPFTVAAAADLLADRLGLEMEVRTDTAEGLREMVRSAIRNGGKSIRVDEFSSMPVIFTVQKDDGEYVRVPASQATIGHLAAHEREIRDRAEATLRRADELQETLSVLIMSASNFEASDLRTLQELEDSEIARVMSMQISPIIDRRKKSEGWIDRQAERAA
jgi:hypothetical protein